MTENNEDVIKAASQELVESDGQGELVGQTSNVVPTTPMEMLGVAVANGAPLEQIEKLMQLSERMEDREAEKAFVTAMAAFKQEAPTLIKNKTVSYENSKGQTTSYDHASLDQVVNNVSPVMGKHGLYHGWITEQLDGGMIQVTCTVTHCKGHSKSTKLSASRDESGKKNNIQAMGSTITYLERYTLLAALGLAVEGQDNDAIDAMAVITEEQHEELTKLLDLKGVDIEEFCKYFDITKVSELSANSYQKAITMVKSK